VCGSISVRGPSTSTIHIVNAYIYSLWLSCVLGIDSLSLSVEFMCASSHLTKCCCWRFHQFQASTWSTFFFFIIYTNLSMIDHTPDLIFWEASTRFEMLFSSVYLVCMYFSLLIWFLIRAAFILTKSFPDHDFTSAFFRGPGWRGTKLLFSPLLLSRQSRFSHDN
jgi:hypothetical protein